MYRATDRCGKLTPNSLFVAAGPDGTNHPLTCQIRASSGWGDRTQCQLDFRCTRKIAQIDSARIGLRRHSEGRILMEVVAWRKRCGRGMFGKHGKSLLAVTQRERTEWTSVLVVILIT